MGTRGTVGGVVASAAIIVIAWQVGQAAASASSPVAATLPTSSGTAAAGPPTIAPMSSSPSATASATASATPSAPATSAAAAPAPTQAAAPAKAAPAPAPAPAKPAPSGTFDGQTFQTPYGNMQVAVVVASGKITGVKVLQSTTAGQRSIQISSYAEPILHDEVIQAQSTNVQMVSGATYTSEGYLQSLQSALDKAGI